MAPALNLNKPPTPTTMTTEPLSSLSGNDPQQQQLLSSSSSTVSQSPIQEDDSNNDTLIGADHSCSNNDAAVTSTIQQQQQQSSSRSNAAIINPYKKSNPPPSSANNSHEDQESSNGSNKRRQFIERYRLQAVHYTQHHSRQRQQQQQRRGCMSVSKVISSKSALEVLRLNQTWRQIWRRCDQSSGDCASSGKQQQEVAVRPRLFLFQRLIQQHQQQQQFPTPQQQHQQQQGVWELGTGITEISGEGGSGKTQICLGLCMNCALTPLLFDASTDSSNHGTNIGSNTNNSSSNDPLYYTSIYITMGEGIPQSKIASRLDQMVRHRLTPPNNNHNTNINPDNEEVERILSRIWLLSLKNEDDFIEFVEIHLPNILNNQSHGIKPHHHHHQQQQQQQSSVPPNNQYPISDRIGFIAFDGIANFFRFSDPLFQQFQSSSSSYNNQRSMFHQTRSSKLFQLSSLLRRMSDLYDVPMVITNQVTMSVPSDDGLLKRPSVPPSSTATTSSLSSMGQQDGNHQVQPALGLIWSNCVTTRFILHRKDGLMAKISTENDNLNDSEKKGTTRMQRVRKARVLQSVCTPEESEVWYFIDTGAVVAVS